MQKCYIPRLKEWNEKEKSEQSETQWYSGEQEAISDSSSSSNNNKRKINAGGGAEGY